MHVSDIEKLPLFAVFSFVKLPSTFDLKLPDSFVGDELSGVIRLRNDSGRTVSFEGVRTSCGCIVAQSEDRDIEASEATPLLVKFKLKQSGRFNNSLRLSSIHGEVTIQVAANVAERIAIDHSDLIVDKSANSVPVVVDVNDPALLGQELSVTSSSGSIKLANVSDAARPGRFNYDLSFGEDTIFPATVQLAFFNREKPVRFCLVTVSMPDSINVSPRHVYAVKLNDDTGLQFRLILTGDTAPIAINNSGSLDVFDNMTNGRICTKTVQYSVKRIGNAVVLTAVLPYENDVNPIVLDSQPSVLKVDNCEMKFRLSLR